LFLGNDGYIAEDDVVREVTVPESHLAIEPGGLVVQREFLGEIILVDDREGELVDSDKLDETAADEDGQFHEGVSYAVSRWSDGDLFAGGLDDAIAAFTFCIHDG
jgi:hypothetical protein